MTDEIFFDLYEGDGSTIEERNRALPFYKPVPGMADAKNYIASPELRDAVNVAVALGQPLLVTGEPGTGKTCLAESVAYEFRLNLEKFHTKTTSMADDLFYRYDAMRRYQDSQTEEGAKPVEHYIACRALGAAIILANPTTEGKKILPKEKRGMGPVRSVVLIDEIDKAPRDLPNDILNEVERMFFEIRETDWPPFVAAAEYRPILILTSNSEKNLPDAFLRRCVFHHIEFPKTKDLKKIVLRRFGGGNGDGKGIVLEKKFVDAALEHFEGIRKLKLKKRPATAELLSWLTVLHGMKAALEKPGEEDRKKLQKSYAALAKNRDDLESLKRYVNQLFT